MLITQLHNCVRWISKSFAAFIPFSIILFFNAQIFAKATWVHVSNLTSDCNGGVILLRTDATVIVKGYNSMHVATPDKLTPDNQAGFIYGTWSTAAQMSYGRSYFSSLLLNDKRVYAESKTDVFATITEMHNPGNARVQSFNLDWDESVITGALPDDKKSFIPYNLPP